MTEQFKCKTEGCEATKYKAKGVCHKCYMRALRKDQSYREKEREKEREYEQTHREQRREYREANREAIREYQREYWQSPEGRAVARRKARARRARKLGAYNDGYTEADLQAWWSDRDYTGCVYCGGPFEHLDHIKALARGGDEARYNLAPSCEHCNTSKGDRDVIWWLYTQGPLAGVEPFWLRGLESSPDVVNQSDEFVCYTSTSVLTSQNGRTELVAQSGQDNTESTVSI